jgi:hypothetical protein
MARTANVNPTRRTRGWNAQLTTVGTVVAILSAVAGIASGMGAYVFSDAKTQYAVSNLETRQSRLHEKSSKGIDDLQSELKGMSERMMKLETDNEWLKAESSRVVAQSRTASK